MGTNTQSRILIILCIRILLHIYCHQYSLFLKKCQMPQMIWGLLHNSFVHYCTNSFVRTYKSFVFFCTNSFVRTYKSFVFFCTNSFGTDHVCTVGAGSPRSILFRSDHGGTGNPSPTKKPFGLRGFTHKLM